MLLLIVGKQGTLLCRCCNRTLPVPHVIIRTFHFPLRAACQTSTFFCFYHSRHIWWTVHVMKLVILAKLFFPLYLGPIIDHRNLFQNTFSLCSSYMVRHNLNVEGKIKLRRTTVLPCYCTCVLTFCCTTVLPYYFATVLHYCTALPYCCITALP
jgi:hypothetical protein